MWPRDPTGQIIPAFYLVTFVPERRGVASEPVAALNIGFMRFAKSDLFQTLPRICRRICFHISQGTALWAQGYYC